MLDKRAHVIKWASDQPGICSNTQKGEKLRKPPIISIVDDDESVRRALKSLVRSLGYDTATFASAEEYLDSEALQDTSCLITDIQMPGMNGIELRERLVRDGHPAKVIFITGFPEETLRTRALEAGAVGFLRKPFDDHCLIKYLDKALEATGTGSTEH